MSQHLSDIANECSSGGIAAAGNIETYEEAASADPEKRQEEQVKPGLTREQLKAKNKHLAACLKKQISTETELRQRLEELEKRQMQKDGLRTQINRNWNQLDEDVNVLLQGFNDEQMDDAGQMATVHIDKQHANEDEVTTSFLTQLATCDEQELETKLANRSEMTKLALGRAVDIVENMKHRSEMLELNLNLNKFPLLSIRNFPNQSQDATDEQRFEAVLKSTKTELTTENETIQRRSDVSRLLLKKIDEISQRVPRHEEASVAVEQRNAALKTQLEELQYDSEKISARQCKLEECLAETLKKLNNYRAEPSTKFPLDSCLPTAVLQELKSDLKENRELARNRSDELQKLKEAEKEALDKIQQLKVQLANIPESRIAESTDFLILQTHYSVLYNETLQMKADLATMQVLLQKSKTEHGCQMQHLQSEQNITLSALNEKKLELDKKLNCFTQDYEAARVNFSGEMKELEEKTSLQQQLSSLHGEKKALNDEIKNLKRKIEDTSRENYRMSYVTSDAEAADHRKINLEEEQNLKKMLEECREYNNELKMQLEMHKIASEETRSNSEIIDSNDKLYTEIADLRRSLAKEVVHPSEELTRRIHELWTERCQLKEQKARAEEEAAEAALAATNPYNTVLKELALTNEANDQLAEQNYKLLQALNEKTDVNLKLNLDQKNDEKQTKLMRNETKLMKEQAVILDTQYGRMTQVLSGLNQHVACLEKTITLNQNELKHYDALIDFYKKKETESTQSAADLNLHFERSQKQLKQAEELVADKTGAVETEKYKVNRLLEELDHYKRKEAFAKQEDSDECVSYDLAKIREARDLKNELTCSSCKESKKDAMLSTCFHVFCFECLDTRYKTRERRCPECNQPFGANDYHRIYF